MADLPLYLHLTLIMRAAEGPPALEFKAEQLSAFSVKPEQTCRCPWNLQLSLRGPRAPTKDLEIVKTGGMDLPLA